MKDNFSSQSDHFLRFRPGYPEALYTWLLSVVPGREAAWDCGTGNGQVAGELARYFTRVFATDISQQQLDQAVKAPNLTYSCQPAERTDFLDQQFNLITVAQAIHWFDFSAFYREVRRTLKKNGILAVTGYGLLRITPAIDAVIDHFYTAIVGPWWDAERKYVDEGYRTIPFPMDELEAPLLENRYDWTLDHLLGYLYTWSAVKHYHREKGEDPVKGILPELRAAWGKEMVREVRFPLLLRVGRAV